MAPTTVTYTGDTDIHSGNGSDGDYVTYYTSSASSDGEGTSLTYDNLLTAIRGLESASPVPDMVNISPATGWQLDAMIKEALSLPAQMPQAVEIEKLFSQIEQSLRLCQAM